MNAKTATYRFSPRTGLCQAILCRTIGRRTRRGSVLICVLVCLSVATALVTASVHTALQARRQMRAYRQLRQTELLLEAGAQRAVGQLRASADYTGEMWNLAVTTIPGFESARVEIEVEGATGDTLRRIHVVARLPAGEAPGVQRSTTLLVDTPKSPTKSPAETPNKE